jgi:abortive infection bacteriophage resistance protein
MAVIEHELQLHLGVLQTNKRFVSFGTLRKRVFTMPVEVHQAIAIAFGCRNSREFSSLLLNFNEARNTAAHHARFWNRNFHFAIPKRFVSHDFENFGRAKSSNSPAAFLTALHQVLQTCPPFLELNNELDDLVKACPVNRGIVLGRMGFEAP